MAYSSGQKYLAEFVGTMGLLLAVGGAAVFSLTEVTDPLSRVLLVSMSVGVGLIGLIYAFGDISGGHFNPAVTIGAWVAGRMPARDVVPYILAQVAGGVLGMGIVAGSRTETPISSRLPKRRRSAPSRTREGPPRGPSAWRPCS